MTLTLSFLDWCRVNHRDPDSDKAKRDFANYSAYDAYEARKAEKLRQEREDEKFPARS